MNKVAWQDFKGSKVIVGSYEEAVRMMGEMNFLQSLLNFPKEAINDETVELLQVPSIFILFLWIHKLFTDEINHHTRRSHTLPPLISTSRQQKKPAETSLDSVTGQQPCAHTMKSPKPWNPKL